MHRPGRVLATLASSLLLAPLAPAVIAPTAQAAPVPAATPAATASPDFDGDGKADIASIMPTSSEIPFVRVWYGSGTTKDISSTELGVGEYGIGNVLLARDLNSDGFTDLIVATQTATGPGVQVVPGSATGLQPAARYGLDGLNKASTYVSSLALVESPVRRLAVGITITGGGKFDGEVQLFKLTNAGLPTGSALKLKPSSGKIPKTVKNARFGAAMDSWGNQLFIGAPYTKVSGKTDAGAVVAVTLDSAGVKSVKTVTQATKSVTGAPGKGDLFGAAVVARDGYLVVGTPRDAVGSIKQTGSIQVFSLSKGALKPVKRISQNSAGIPGKAERYDSFGAVLAIGAVCNGVPAVLVGGPGESLVKGHEWDGSAWLIPLKTVKGCAAKQIYEGNGLPGTPGWRFMGDLLAFVRDAGATTDDLVIGGGGSFSEGPAGRIYRVSGMTGTATKLNPDDIFYTVAGR